jgi:hypothetical protein
VYAYCGQYSLVQRFWPAKEVADLVVEPTVCGEMAWDRIYFLQLSVSQGQLCRAGVL